MPMDDVPGSPSYASPQRPSPLSHLSQGLPLSTPARPAAAPGSPLAGPATPRSAASPLARTAVLVSAMLGLAGGGGSGESGSGGEGGSGGEQPAERCASPQFELEPERDTTSPDPDHSGRYSPVASEAGQDAGGWAMYLGSFGCSPDLATEWGW